MRVHRLLMVFVMAFWASAAALAADAPAAAPAETFVTPQVLAPELKEIDHEGAGRLYEAGTHLVCVMEGTPEAMGFQHGRLLAKQIHHVIKEGYMVKMLWARGYTPEYVKAQSERMEKHFPAEYVAELQGLVKGLRAAGIDDITYEDVRTGVTQAEICHHGPNAPPACSNFAVFGQWTRDGRLLHGRNLDWSIERGAQEDAVILVWRPKGGIPFMLIGWAGGIGSVTGMNARGITVGEMTSVSTDETFDGLPLMLMLRRVVDHASTADEAVAVIRESPRTTGWNVVIGDGAKPDARALEIDAKDCVVFGPADPKENAETLAASMPDAVRRTNHPCSPIMIEKLAGRYGPQFGLDPKQWRAALPILQVQNTWQRYDWLGKQFEARKGKMEVEDCLQLLANGPVKNDATLHSCVFDPKHQTVYVAVAGSNPSVTATERPFTKIDLSPWFK